MAEEWVYGVHAVTAALKYEPGQLRGLWVERQRRDTRLQALIDVATHHGVAIRPVERSELDRLSGGARHQGVMARLAQSQKSYQEQNLADVLSAAVGSPLLLVLDGVQDPHNLGACLRSAAAAGVTAVIAPADRAVGLNATVRKVACGAAEIVPFIPVTNVARILEALQQQGLWIVGAVGEAEQTLYQIDFTVPAVIVLGAEDKGLRRLTRERCDHLVRIPMVEGGVESLNVSVATGIFLFEARRQRGLRG
jgi:23S rRNA (guanosine2251-2'-O)-methyltransferase